MPAILARLGPYTLYAYTVILGVGLLMALGLTAVLSRRAAAPAWLDGALAAAAGALLAGRVAFVWFNTAYFAENPAEAWQIWRGGLAYHGALLGGAATLWLWAKVTRRPFRDYAGLFAPGLALLAVFGWAACRSAGCAYGLPTTPGPWAFSLPDNLGVIAVRYRTQLAGALGTLVVFGLSLRAFGQARPALLFWGTLGGLSLVRAVVALGRGDPAAMVGGVRLDLAADLLIFGAAIAAMLIIGRRNPPA